MVPEFARQFRHALTRLTGQEQEDFLTAVFTATTAACAEVADLTVSMGFGNPLRDTNFRGARLVDGGTPDVVVTLVTDPLDIDSKWMTHVSPRVASSTADAVFKRLYKWHPRILSVPLAGASSDGEAVVAPPPPLRATQLNTATNVNAGNTVRILHLSDTHGLHRTIEDETGPLPAADIVLHTGDFTDKGTPAEFADFNEWIKDLQGRFAHVIVITGNHEWKRLHLEASAASSQPAGSPARQAFSALAQASLDPAAVKALVPDATVLHHESATVMGLHIYGSCWCPWHTGAAPGDAQTGGRALKLAVVRAEWQRQEQEAQECPGQEAGGQGQRGGRGPDGDGNSGGGGAERAVREHRFGEIPDGVDILLTHGPSYGILDRMETTNGHWGGSRALRAAIARARPRAHLFGHLHEQRGVWRREALQGQQPAQRAEPPAPGALPLPLAGAGAPPPPPHPPSLGAWAGRVDYQLVPGVPFHTFGPPPPDYPVQFISCNAMLNHSRMENCTKRIAGPGRLIIAERHGEGAPWSFSEPGPGLD
jgi:hypothetical protein